MISDMEGNEELEMKNIWKQRKNINSWGEEEVFIYKNKKGGKR